jgi:hypothetical protein
VITRNAAAIAAAYTQAESFVFANLKKLLARFAPWVVLGMVPDLDDFVASKATTVTEAESLLENLKAVLRDLPRAVPHEVHYEQYLLLELLCRATSVAVYCRLVPHYANQLAFGYLLLNSATVYRMFDS